MTNLPSSFRFGGEKERSSWSSKQLEFACDKIVDALQQKRNVSEIEKLREHLQEISGSLANLDPEKNSAFFAKWYDIIQQLSNSQISNVHKYASIFKKAGIFVTEKQAFPCDTLLHNMEEQKRNLVLSIAAAIPDKQLSQRLFSFIMRLVENVAVDSQGRDIFLLVIRTLSEKMEFLLDISGMERALLSLGNLKEISFFLQFFDEIPQEDCRQVFLKVKNSLISLVKSSSDLQNVEEIIKKISDTHNIAPTLIAIFSIAEKLGIKDSYTLSYFFKYNHRYASYKNLNEVVEIVQKIIAKGRIEEYLFPLLFYNICSAKNNLTKQEFTVFIRELNKLLSILDDEALLDAIEKIGAIVKKDRTDILLLFRKFLEDYPEIRVDHTISNVLDVFFTSSREELDRFLAHTAPLLHDTGALKMESLSDVIGELFNCPISERKNILLETVDFFEDFNISGWHLALLISSVKDIPFDKRKKILQELKPIAIENNYFSIPNLHATLVPIIRIINGMQPKERAFFLELLQSFLDRNMSASQIEEVVKIAADLCKRGDDSTRSRMQDISHYLSDGHSKLRVMKTFFQLPAVEREENTLLQLIFDELLQGNDEQKALLFLNIIPKKSLSGFFTCDHLRSAIANHHQLVARKIISTYDKEQIEDFLKPDDRGNTLWHDCVRASNFECADYFYNNYNIQFQLDDLVWADWFAPPVSLTKDQLDYVYGKLPVSDSLRSFMAKYKKASPEDESIIQEVLRRAAERYPRFIRGEVEKENINEFLDTVLSCKQRQPHLKKLLQVILKQDLKANQKIALTKDNMENILDLFARSKDHTKLHLVLQTHDNLDEIKRVVDTVGFGRLPVDKQRRFFELSSREKADFLLRSALLRDRRAIPLAQEILAQAVSAKHFSADLLEQSCKVFLKTEISGGKETVRQLLSIIRSEKFDTGIRKLAARALGKVEENPGNSKRKNALREILRTVNDADLQASIVDCLGEYDISEEDEKIVEELVNLSAKTTDVKVKRSLAFALSTIPREEALREALSIVNSVYWDDLDLGLKQQHRVGRAGDLFAYTYRPLFFDNRDNMIKIIAERLVIMKRERIKEKIEDRLRAYRQHPQNDPTLKQLEDAIRKPVHAGRFLPLAVYFPEKGRIFRGVKPGPNMFEDLLMKGPGSSSLESYQSSRTYFGNWMTWGQIFSSVALSEAESYMGADGILLVISAKAINEAQLRRRIRLQRANATLHPVSYERIRQRDITSLMVQSFGQHAQYLDKLDMALSSHSYQEGRENVQTDAIVEIAKKRLAKKAGRVRPLRERIQYFDPEQGVEAEVKRISAEQGWEEMSLDDIVKENLERQIVREFLAETVEDDQFKQCLIAASGKEPLPPPGEPLERSLHNKNMFEIVGNKRPGYYKEIIIPVARVNHLRLKEENLEEIFRLANEYTVNKPYPLSDDCGIIANRKVYRPNHNGTHSARQVRYMEALFALIEKQGGEEIKKIFRTTTSEERLALQLAAYFLRVGRVDESSWQSNNPDDYYTRSALIFANYAKQLGVSEKTCLWAKKMLRNACKPEKYRDRDFDSDPKNQLAYALLTSCHLQDLLRCRGQSTYETYDEPLLVNFLKYFMPNKTQREIETCREQLLTFSKNLHEATGQSHCYDGRSGNSEIFALCSTEGDYCWRQLKAVNIPSFVL